MLRRTFDVRTRQLPFLGGLAFRIFAARALQHRLKCRRRLLHEVRQLVRQQFLTRACLRRVLTGAEHDIASDRVGERVDRARRIRGAGIRMHAHLAQITAETRLHHRACLTMERLAGIQAVHRVCRIRCDRRTRG